MSIDFYSDHFLTLQNTYSFWVSTISRLVSIIRKIEETGRMFTLLSQPAKRPRRGKSFRH